MRLISGEKYLLDTNVLVYAVDRASPLAALSRQIIEQGASHGVEFVIAQQNLIEFMAVLSSGYGLPLRQALDDAESFARSFRVIVPLTSSFETFTAMIRQNKTKLYPFDLYLVATMLDNSVERIVTRNPKDFQGLPLKEIVSLE